MKQETILEKLKNICLNCLANEPSDPTEREIGYSAAMEHIVQIIDKQTNKVEKQTAVEWLINQIEEKGDARKTPYTTIIELNLDTSEYNELIKQAKEMEKEQIVNSWDLSRRDIDYLANGEQYYKETYKNN
jgi:hypothetical protein